MENEIIMGRMDRLRELKNPASRSNWRGAGRDQSNIDRWSARATENSQIAPRATNKAISLPDTNSGDGVKPKTRPGNMRQEAKRDLNDVGSSFMPRVRRTTI